MVAFSPLRTGQLVVRYRTPWRRRLVTGVAVVGLSLIPYLAYEWGRASSGYNIVEVTQERMEHAARVRKLEEQLTALQTGVAEAELARNVDRESYASVQKNLTELQAQVRAQRDELTFYQAIVSPKDGPSGPRVQRLDIQREAEAGHYELHLLLIQSLLQEAPATGSMKIDIEGTRDGQASSLPVAEMSDDRSGLAFSFRYFQELQEQVTVPEGFIPAAINVEVHVGRQVVNKQSFPWQLQAES